MNFYSPSKQHAKIIVVLMAIVWTFFSYWAMKVEKRGDADVLLSSDDPEVQLRREMEETFGNANFVLITLPEKKSFELETLKKFRAVYQGIEADNKVKEVHSVFSTQLIKAVGSGFEVVNIAPEQFSSLEDIETLRENLLASPSYKGTVASLDLKKLSMVVEFKSKVLEPEKVSLVTSILNQNDVLNLWTVSGLPIVNTEIVSLIDKDLMILFPGFSLLLIIVLYMAFRSIVGVVLPWIVVMFSITVVVGVMSMFGWSLNVVSNNIPMLLTCIGGAYGIHYLNQYQMFSQSLDPYERSKKTNTYIGPTVLLASVTTILGFLANGSSTVAAVKQFGILMALGLAVLFFSTVLILPSLLILLGDKAKLKEKQPKEFEDSRLIKMISKFRFLLVVVTMFIMGWSFVSFSHLNAEYKTLGYFHNDSKIVKDARNTSKDLGGITTFDIVIQSQKEEGIIDPKVLNVMDKFTNDWIKKRYPEDIRVTMTFADFVKEMSESYNGEEKYFRIPNSSDEVFQYLEVYSWTSDLTDDFRGVLSEDMSSARLTGRMSIRENSDGTFEETTVQYQNSLIEDSITWLQGKLGPEFKIYAFGDVPIWAKVNREIINGQITSIVIAIILVWIITFMVFRSIIYSLLCLIPIILAVSFNFIIMDLFHINLDIATTLVSSMAIGIGIDDTIHFMLSYSKNCKQNEKNILILRRTINTTGRAIIYTSIALVLGFLVFCFSEFKPVVYFGALNALTIFIATISTLIVLPAAILIFNPGKVKE